MIIARSAGADAPEHRCPQCHPQIARAALADAPGEVKQ